MAVLAVQRDSKIVLFKREEGTADVDIDALTADEAKRFGNAILTAVPGAREAEAAAARASVTEIEAELKAAHDQVVFLEDKLQRARTA